MRPVNLIPVDQRRGDRSPMRTGKFSYVLIGGLALALLAVIALAFTSKQVSDRKNEVTDLKVQEQQATAKAQSLQSFADFRAMQQSRSDTVTSLAQSRFDWQRVLNELARVIPSNIWLVQLAGTVDPTVTVENSPDIPHPRQHPRARARDRGLRDRAMTRSPAWSRTSRRSTASPGWAWSRP